MAKATGGIKKMMLKPRSTILSSRKHGSVDDESGFVLTESPAVSHQPMVDFNPWQDVSFKINPFQE